MKNIRLWKILITAVLVVIVGVLLAETLIVKVQSTNLRQEPKFFSPSIATLKAGETAEKIAEQGGWFKVKTAKGLVGWLHSSAVQARKFNLLAMDKPLETKATADEVALASKGFNKQVEEKYRARNTQISFEWVEKMLKIGFTPEQIRRFLEEGKLAEFGGAQ